MKGPDIVIQKMSLLHRIQDTGHFKAFLVLDEDEEFFILLMDIFIIKGQRNNKFATFLMKSQFSFFDKNFPYDTILRFDPDPDMDEERLRNFFRKFGFKWDILYNVYRRKSLYVK